MKKRILITGGAGSIGSHLCEKLHKEENEVICVDNFYTGTKRNIVHLRKTKIGFNSPVIDWMRGPLKNWFLDIVHSKEFHECPLIENPKKVGQLTLNIINGKESSFNFGERVWTDISTYLWEKAVIEGWKDYLKEVCRCAES